MTLESLIPAVVDLWLECMYVVYIYRAQARATHPCFCELNLPLTILQKRQEAILDLIYERAGSRNSTKRIDVMILNKVVFV